MSEYEKHRIELLETPVDLGEVEKEVFRLVQVFDEFDTERREQVIQSAFDESGPDVAQEFEEIVDHEIALTHAVIRNVFKPYRGTPLQKITGLKDFCSADNVPFLTRTEQRGDSRLIIQTKIRGLCMAAITRVVAQQLLLKHDALGIDTRENIRREMKEAGVQATEETWLSGELRQDLQWD